MIDLDSDMQYLELRICTYLMGKDHKAVFSNNNDNNNKKRCREVWPEFNVFRYCIWRGIFPNTLGQVGMMEGARVTCPSQRKTGMWEPIFGDSCIIKLEHVASFLDVFKDRSIIVYIWGKHYAIEYRAFHYPSRLQAW